MPKQTKTGSSVFHRAESGLTNEQEEFCKIYSSSEEFFANGTKSYMQAYKMTPDQYKSAMVNASKLLSDAKICQRINELLELRGLNDQFVDKQLEFLITQNADFKTKATAIKEYNKLKQRTDDRTQINLTVDLNSKLDEIEKANQK